MSQHEDDGGIICEVCGEPYDCHPEKVCVPREEPPLCPRCHRLEATHAERSPNCQRIRDEAKRSAAVYTLPGGAQRSERAARYDLIPAAGLRRIAQRFALGAKTHGEGNWLKSLDTREHARAFALEAYNHMQEHLQKMINGEDPEDDHLGAVGWAVLVLIQVEKQLGCRWREL